MREEGPHWEECGDDLEISTNLFPCAGAGRVRLGLIVPGMMITPVTGLSHVVSGKKET